MNGIREVALPFVGKKIQQNTMAQGVSLASSLLYEAAADAFEDAPITVLELGCGCGIVSIMCALARPLWQVHGIDIQEDLIILANANAQTCAVDISFSHQDLREQQGRYDLILANPPWQKVGSGLLSPHAAKNLSRVELSCSMPELLSAIERCLNPDGVAIVIYPISRFAEFEIESAKTSLDIIDRQTQFGKKAYFCAKLSIGN